MTKLSRNLNDRLTEALGGQETIEESERHGEEIDRGFEEDDATVDFNEKWGAVLRESEIEGMKEFIRKTRRRQPLPQDVLPENEEYAMAVVLLVKLGFHRVADFLKTCVNTPEGTSPEGIEWDEVTQQLDNL